MTVVKYYNDEIIAIGHKEYTTRKQDIVCAEVLATFKNGGWAADRVGCQV